MALMKSANVPKDAVILDEHEAAGYIWDIVNNWEFLSDTWCLRFGAVSLAAISSMSGIIINKHFRWRFKLGNYGYLSSTFPIAVMPGTLTLVLHKYTVTTNILLMKNNVCPICYEVKSAALQMALGIAYPMVLAPTSALMFAHRYDTFRIPHLKEGAKVMLKFLGKHTKPFTATLIYLAVLQLAASSVITYYEMRNNITLRNKMMEIEQKVLDQAI